MVVEATGTNDAWAAGTAAKAAAAVGVVTNGTLTDAVTAETAFAVSAGGLTVAADGVFAALTLVAILGRDRFTAVAAAFAIPKGQLDEWAFAVVRPQQVHHELEEVQQPTLSERLPDRGSAVAFAQRLVADMRVRDAFAGGGRLGIECNHAVRRVLRQPP
jgi:hypothetical protein